MERSFSLATLNLMVAIAAVGLACCRSALASDWKVPPQLVVGLMLLGGIFGMIFGLILAVWNRPGWLAMVGCVLGGFFLGFAAAGQLAVKVDWPVIFATPYVMISAVALLALNHRRKQRSRREIFNPPSA
jgi:hypothetical protein